MSALPWPCQFVHSHTETPSTSTTLHLFLWIQVFTRKYFPYLKISSKSENTHPHSVLMHTCTDWHIQLTQTLDFYFFYLKRKISKKLFPWTLSIISIFDLKKQFFKERVLITTCTQTLFDVITHTCKQQYSGKKLTKHIWPSF